MDFLNSVVGSLNNIIWGYVLIAMLIVLGVLFSVKTSFVQVKFIKEMVRLLGEGAKGNNGKGVSSFQAFCISTASRVGTGNLAGVAIAIAMGGPGAIFWMWLIAIIGGASSFVESTIAQIYKVKDEDSYRGGPAYFMEMALNKKWMGVIFSILITICFGLIFNSVQSNTISLAFNQAFGISRLGIGIGITVLTAAVIFGGVKRIANFSGVVVPVMAVAYIAVALIVILMNITALPGVIAEIFAQAFGVRQAVSGGMGAAMMLGIKRGLFSNEAGMGSAPNAAATAEVTHPVKQGLIQTLGVFTDTLIICSCTGFMVLLSGAHTATGLTGIQLTQQALSSQVGAWGHIFVAVCILLFAFSSIIGNYYYGETNIEFLSENKMWLNIYRAGVIAMVLFGSVSEMAIVWDLADLFMGLMAIINLIAITMLGKVAYSALADYAKQKKQGLDPVFYVDSIELPNAHLVKCWDRNRETETVSLKKATI